VDAGTITDVAEVGGWLGVIVAAVVVVTQRVGWSRPGSLAVLQSLTPQLVGLLALIGLVAAGADRPVLGLTAAVIGLVTWMVVFTTVRPPPRRSDPTSTPAVRVAAVNLLYSSTRIPEVGDVLAAIDADVIVFTELTPEHAAALHTHGMAGRYTQRCEHPGDHAAGIGVWSRLPLVEKRQPDADRGSLDVALTSGAGELRMLAVHPLTPVEDVDLWQQGLAEIGSHVSGIDAPVLVVGDFNATYWHPPFRRLTGDGLTDAHVVHGRGLSVSWPTDLVIPPFVRLDHVLTGNGLIPTEIVDFDVPGSDHRGFVVTVVPADRGGPGTPAPGER
jgi:endonuclease/exonuclease/phosphatase (EEP) superfamily protein YafD